MLFDFLFPQRLKECKKTGKIVTFSMLESLNSQERKFTNGASKRISESNKAMYQYLSN